MKEVYEDLFDSFIEEFDDVGPGVMMREPAVTFRNKVFMFYYADKGAMCFKLGKGFQIDEFVESFEFLSPFKNKPPMYAWYLVSADEQHAWEELAHLALENMRG